MADFGRNPCSSDSLRWSRNFCPVNNARFHRFPVGKILQHFDATMSISEVVKTFGTEFRKFYHKESFFKKANIAQKIPGLSTSGHHNSTMITNAENARPNGTPMGCLVSIFTIRINSKSFSGLCAVHQKTFSATFSAR